MSKVKEFYYESQNSTSGKNSLPCGRIPANRPRESRRRKKDEQIEGQISFEIEGTDISVKDEEKLRAEQIAEEREARAEAYKQAKLKYYDAWLDMLRRYGKFNMSYNIIECVENSERMTDNVRNAINYHYGGDIENVRRACGRAKHWLTVSRDKFSKAAHDVGLYEVDGRYDAIYRDEQRRSKYRQIINREIKRINRGKDVEVYTPKELEAEYQTWRAAKESKSKGS